MCVAPVRRREAMVTVTFVSSVQGYQEGRVAEIVERLRTDHPEWKVDVLSPEASKPLLATYKLPFGPAILLNERIEFVGVPRYRMLVERIAMVAAGKVSPRTAQPPTPTTPAVGGGAKPTSPILQWKAPPGRRRGDHGDGFCSGVAGGLAGAVGLAPPPTAGVVGVGG